MNRNYVRGRAYEYRLKKKWEKEGWTVLRMAGSHGEFDLIAIKRVAFTGRFENSVGVYENQIVLIQAKSGKSAKREKAKLEPLKAKYEGLYSVRVEIL